MYNSCVHRYKLPVHKSQIKWLIDVICQYELNAFLMDMYEFKALRDEAGFKMNMPEFLEFLVSRGKIDLSPKNSDPFYRLSSDFRTVEWCFFAKEDSEEIQAFYKICALLSESEFIYKYTLPKYIADLDQGAVYTAQFITDFFSQTINPEIEVFEALAELAAIHSDDSQEWHKIAEPICKKALLLNRNDRESIYFTLYHGDRTTALYKMPGQVNDHYYQALKKARKLLEDEKSEALKEYREWVLERAEKILRHEKEMAGLDTEYEGELYPEEGVAPEQEVQNGIFTEEGENFIEKSDNRVAFDPSKIRVLPKQDSLKKIIERLEDKTINIDSKIQRNPDLWNDLKKSRLIESILLRLPLPAFYFDVSDDQEWLVIDGLQRLSTIKKFVTGGFKLCELEYLTDLEGSNYENLSYKYKRRIKDCHIIMFNIMPGTPVDIKYSLFRRINTGGLPLNDQELRSTMNKKARAFLEEMAKNLYLKSLSKFDSARMLDQEVILRFIACYRQKTVESETDIISSLDREMEILNELDEFGKSEIKKSYEAVVKTVSALFNDVSIQVGEKFYISKGQFGNESLFVSWLFAVSILDSYKKDKLIKRRLSVIEKFKALFVDESNFQVIINGQDSDKMKYLYYTITKIIDEVLHD
jgi:hypothetical protein